MMSRGRLRVPGMRENVAGRTAPERCIWAAPACSLEVSGTTFTDRRPLRSQMSAATRPRMKTTAALLRAGGVLHIVGYHDVHTLADPDGALRRLVELADGSRSTDELFDVLAADYPRLREQDVVDVVDELQSAGLVDDGAGC
jgi:hypothetical protein